MNRNSTAQVKSKDWALVLFFVIGLPVLLYFLWTTTHLVIAYQETKHAHIFPKSVEGSGWGNSEKALSRDLPPQASYGSFNTTNSSYIELPASTSTGELLHEVDLPEATPGTAASSSQTAPPEREIPGGTATPTPSETTQGSSALSPSASSSGTETLLDRGVSQDTTDTPNQNDANTPSETPPFNIIELLKAAMPVKSTSTNATTTVGTTTSFLQELLPVAKTKLQGMGEFLLSQLVETAFATTTGISTPATSTASSSKEKKPDIGPTSPFDITGEATPTFPGVGDVSSCTITREKCHLMQFSGFGVSGSLTEKEFHGAQLNFSFANMSLESAQADGKLSVRYFHAGKWQTAGEVFLNKELSNFTNGDYFSAKLDGINGWSDLSDVRVVVEYIRGDERVESKVYLDALWIDSSYKDRVQDILSGQAGTTLIDVPANVSLADIPSAVSNDLLVSGSQMLFPYRDSLTDTGLILRTNSATYQSSTTPVYVSVTNTGKDAETFQFLISATGTVQNLEQYLHNVPTEKIDVQKESVAYFCDSGWDKATSSTGYICRATLERRECTILNDSKENCTVAGVAIASTTAITYTDTWVPQSLATSSIDLKSFKKHLPDGFALQKITEREVTILPGQTVYFRITLREPDTNALSFKLSAQGKRSFGNLDSVNLRNEAALTADNVSSKKRGSDNINKQLSSRYNFTSDELPEFKFQYNSQRNIFVRFFRKLFGIQTEAKVNEVILVHHSGKQYRMPADISYSADGEWDVKFKERPKPLMPGEYTLLVTIQEDGYTYEDAHTFEWGVLTLNPLQSVYTSDDTAEIDLASLSPNGNTMCDAKLELTVTDPLGNSQQPEILPSGKCNGNNFVEVPDYKALYQTNATGTYGLLLTRLDESGNVVAQVEDSFEVRDHDALPVIVSRNGPTRINPTYPYDMQITITANEDWSGVVHEPVLTDDFKIISSNGTHGSGELSWNVNLKAGESQTLHYTFDAADRSPYIYSLGPLSFTEGAGTFFQEVRPWQIASDAAGSMVIYWDDGATVPAGWTCVSCVSTDMFYQKFVEGFSSYGASSSVATFTHTATGAVNSSNSSATESFNAGSISDVGHTHTYTPTIVATSSLPVYRQLRVLQSNSAGEPATIPAGAILMFDAAVPSGWTRYSAQDNDYIRGENTVGSTGGSNTHKHDISGSLDAAAGSDYSGRGGGTQANGAVTGHTHTVSTSTDTVNNEPSYLTVILGKLNSSTSTPNDIISMWTGDIPSGWVSKSNAGDDFYLRFVKPGSTYGTTGGTSTHNHADITGVVSGLPSGSTSGRTGASGASATHTHTVNITNFNYASNTPPYINAIFAKRHTGIPVYTQSAFRWYTNNGVEPPTDPWPFGASDVDENEALTTSNTATSGVVMRLRMNVTVANATSTAGGDAFKLQYASSTSCASATWLDVGDTGSTTTLWRGYDNAGTSDGATLTSTVLSASNVLATYEEQNNSAVIPNDIGTGKYAEWDWVLQHNGATAGATYCFRMVRSDGSALDTYTNYPVLVTNASPASPALSLPFPNQKATSTLPLFDFAMTDPENNDVDYEIQVGTDSTFATGLVIDANSISNPTAFDNLITTSDHEPFNSGDRMRFTATTTISNGTTYWWRIRGKDVKGSNAWSNWSTGQSFTVDTSVTIDTWFQTSDAQFTTDTLSGTQSTGSNSVNLITGSSTGSIYSSSILFSYATIGNAWGSLSWSHSTSTGSIKYFVEYNANGTWTLVPNTDLAGNSSGFTNGPVNLLTMSPTTYPEIRVRADLTNSGGSPTINDWTLAWSTRVNTPTTYYLFDNEKTGTTTPTFEFLTTDPQSDSLVYQVQWSTDSTFGSGTTTKTSDTDAGFQNITSPLNSSPFTSGNRIRFTTQTADALTNNATYWWRVRAKDPSGGNAYSDWSTARSFTVDTSVVQSTWFQTTDAQFNTDTLSGVYAISNSLQVATSVRDVMLAYGEGSVQTPRYRLWDGTTWGSESSALTVGSQINYVVVKAHPSANEYALATQGTNGNLYAQVYQSSAWGSKQLLSSTINSANARAVDLAFESQSGDLLAVYCDGDANPSYRVFDGTSWSSASAITTGLTSNCNWMKLASDPVSDEIIMLEQTADGGTFQARVWNGSAWGNATTLGTNNGPSAEAMAVEYEESGNQAIILSSDGNGSRIRYSTWNGTAWSAAATQAISARLLWATLKRDVGSDNLILSYVDSSSNVGILRWTGAAWTGQTNLAAATADSITDRGVDGVFETSAGRDGFIMVPYSNTTAAQYQSFNGAAWSGASTLASIPRAATVQAVRDGGGTILALAFNRTNVRYDFTSWNGSSWATLQTLESSPSVTTSPFKEPFMMAPRNSSTAGSVFSSSAVFTNGAGPRWESALWSDTQTGGSTIKYHLQYYTSTSTWANVLDADLSGNNPGLTNSVGTSTGPINLTGLNTTTYGTLRLRGDFTCNGATCPTLSDWTIRWAPGYTISGTAKQFDQSTNVTSGTVAVAVNGALQVGKIAAISGSGTWSISNVNFAQGDVLTLFVDGVADASEAITVMKATSTANIGAVPLYQRHLTIAKGGSITNADLGNYDNSASGDEDIFYDVDTSNNLTLCAISGCFDSRLLVAQNAQYEPSIAGGTSISLRHLQNDGTFIPDGNTISLSGSWRNSAVFMKGTSTVIFTATSTTETLDDTSATSTGFYVVTFGQTSGSARWNLTTALYASSTMSINFGTVVPGTAIPIALDGDLTIGASGLFTKGTASTTFEGSTSATWSDSSASKQDLGIVVVDGTAKTVTLGSSVKATNLTIGADDTLNAGGANTLTVIGNWTNNNIFTAQTGTVSFIATSTNKTIVQGNSNFYNLTFNGVGGNWAFTGATVTASNDFTIATGTVTLVTGTTTVGGSWDSFSGSFQHNNSVVVFNSTASGKTIHVATSTPFYDMTFNGSGGAWSFIDQNATTSRSLVIQAGTVTMPSGTFLIGGSFDKQGGAFTANSGTLKFTGATQTIKLGGSNAFNLTFNGGPFTMTDTNATSTGTVRFEAGTTTLPSGSLGVGGSFLNPASPSGGFANNNGIVRLIATASGNTITPGINKFFDLIFNGSGGSWTVTQSATSTHNTTLTQANVITFSSGTTFEVDGNFANLLQDASTTWTGAALYLNSGSSYYVNQKSTGRDTYNILTLGANTNVIMWNSSVTTINTASAASLYSQNNAGTSGALNIYGVFATSSPISWAYQMDFDNSTLGAGRQVTVRIASSSVVSLSGSTTIQGIASATTTIGSQGTGFFTFNILGGTTTAKYFSVGSTTPNGLSIFGSNTVIASLDNGAFELNTPSGGTSISVGSEVINKNPQMQILFTKFSTSTGVVSGSNVTATTAPSSIVNYWWFKNGYGPFYGESFDNDIGGSPGYIQFDDSAVAAVISGHVYSDHGTTAMGNAVCQTGTTSAKVFIRTSTGLTYSGTCDNSGAYSINATFVPTAVITAYLNTNGGPRAVTITKNVTGDLSGLDLYQNSVIVRQFDVSPTTIADMNFVDSSFDSDIPFTATSSLMVKPDTELYIWTGKLFSPGGDVTLQSGGSGSALDGRLYMATSSTFTEAGTQNLAIGGGLALDAGATFTSANSQIIFAATTTGKNIYATQPLTLYDVVFKGTGGAWNFTGTSSATTTMHTLTPTSGTVGGTGDVDVQTGGVTGSGTIAMTGGIFRLEGIGNFGNSNSWTFRNLVFGSGSANTITSTGSGTTTVNGFLQVAASQTLQAGSAAWLLYGNGTPLRIDGAFTAQTSKFWYVATTSTNVTPTTYASLFFEPTSSSPTYTVLSGTLTTGTTTIGDGTNAVTVTATANDPTIDFTKDLTINPSAVFVASDLVDLNSEGSWTNSGTFTASGRKVIFDATATGKTVTPGSSSFYDLQFNSSTGGWTVNGHATSTHDTLLSAASSFTLSSGKTLEVDGTFTNSVASSSQTWTGSILYLNSGTSYTINTKSAGNATYGTLSIGANTNIRDWNSAQITTTLNSSASLYAQNYASSTGALNIWGTYARSSGIDYWDYATDFDGVALAGTSRKVTVSIATSSKIIFSGGSLDIIGNTTASTTIQNQGTGAYSFAVGGATNLNAQYYEFRNLDPNGLYVTGTPTMTGLSNGDFQVAFSGNSAMTVAGSVIDANPLKVFRSVKFATSTGAGIVNAINVTSTSSASSYWKFNIAYGGLASEVYDNDVGGDPGQIRFDDSNDHITISGVIYKDDGVTHENAAGCNGVTQVVQLKVEGAGTYSATCSSATGAYSIPNVVYNPGDVITVYLASSSIRSAVVTRDPNANISDMDIYEHRVIVREESTTPLNITDMDQYDSGQDTNIPYRATLGATNTLVVEPNTKLVVWTGKTFAPAGNVTLQSGNSNTWDGSLELLTNSTFTSAGTQAHSIGGSFILDSGAIFAAANSTVTFAATTTGKTITPNSSAFYNVTFNGIGGNWAFSAAATSTNDFTITNGTVTLPTSVLEVGGAFVNSGGTFMHNNGTVKLTSIAATAKNVTVNNSPFYNFIANGVGGAWTFTEGVATSSNDFTITAGTLKAPTTTLAVGGSFLNSGTFTANNGTVRMTSVSGGKSVQAGGSNFYSLIFTGVGGGWSFLDTNATTSRDMNVATGTVTFPSGILSVGGNFTASSTFISNSGTVKFTATTTGFTISVATSSFYQLIFDATAGGWSINSNATSTASTTITNAASLTLQPGKSLEVDGAFTNSVGGAPTVWTSSVLYLNSGTSYSLNTRSNTGDTYGTLLIGSNTQVRDWGSGAATTTVASSASLYSQNDSGTSGSLMIYGAYTRTNGTDFWDYATDFDGTDISGAPRQVQVRVATSSSVSFSGASLSILGTGGATTTVYASGTTGYGFSFAGGSTTMSYYQFKNVDQSGLVFSGVPIVNSLSNGDFELSAASGTIMSLASTVVDANAALTINNVKMSTTSPNIRGFNVMLAGTPTSFWTFTNGYGNFTGEAYDADGTSACGHIQWDDSNCLFTSQSHYRFRNDNGGEGALNTDWYDLSFTRRKKIAISNANATAYTNIPVQISVAYDSDMQSNFDDLRFTDSTGTTSIPYWRETSTASGTSTVWVNISSLPANSSATVYMYYGSSTASGADSASNTFSFIDDFEDNNITEYTPAAGVDKTYFATNSSFGHNGTYGLGASSGNEGQRTNTTGGIYRTGSLTAPGKTIRYFQYVDATGAGAGNDEPCTFFGLQASGQNYGVCLEQVGGNYVGLSKNVKSNATQDGATLLTSTPVTWATGWYQVVVDWQSSNPRITVRVYDSSSALFATLSSNDTTYTSAGGMGFGFFGQHGGWDTYMVKPYTATAPTYIFGSEQLSGGATWKAAEDTAASAVTPNTNLRLRFSIQNSGSTQSNKLFTLQYAAKGAALSCEAVTPASFVDVPSAASCGSNDACMTTSSQFTNLASTSPLLSYPASMNYTPGYMLQDPSNATPAMSMRRNYDAEVEYNFKITSNATLPKYCFRVNDGGFGGLELDSYNHVAEADIAYPPILGSISLVDVNNLLDIALTEGTTTIVYASTTVSDNNGYSDIISATSSIFRSSTTSSPYCASDPNSCYQLTSSSCTYSNCSGNSCTLQCRADLQYFAEPTDSGLYYGYGGWRAYIAVQDSSGLRDTQSNISSSTEVLTLRALTITTGDINFGSLEVGQDTGTVDATSTIKNTGNSPIDITVAGTSTLGTPIPVNSQKYATTTFAYGSCAICSALSASAADVNVSISKPTSTSTARTQDVYWGISIPTGTQTGTLTGYNTFIAVAPPGG